MSAAADLAEFAKRRSGKRVRRHKRRLESGKVITVGVDKPEGSNTSSPVIRNLELLARSARSITYSVDTGHRMFERVRKAREATPRLDRIGRAANMLSREGRGWLGGLGRSSNELRGWASSEKARDTAYGWYQRSRGFLS
jgi:hypothetical protein